MFFGLAPCVSGILHKLSLPLPHFLGLWFARVLPFCVLQTGFRDALALLILFEITAIRSTWWSTCSITDSLEMTERSLGHALWS